MRSKSILAAVLLAGTALAAMPANATLILSDLVFRDLGGLVSAAFGLFGFSWYRRRRNGRLAA
jgi:hypothetical protein